MTLHAAFLLARTGSLPARLAAIAFWMTMVMLWLAVPTFLWHIGMAQELFALMAKLIKRYIFGALASAALSVALPCAVFGQNAPPAISKSAQPVTKLLAIGTLTAKASPDAIGPIMNAEVPATVRLYLAGKIDQWYAKHDHTGVVFILNVTDVAEASAMLEALPLGKAGMMTFEVIPLGPLQPLGRLLADAHP